MPVSAAFVDTQTHWARKYIDRATELGLFKGTSETAFQPEAPMTRAMFVTVLGRLAGIDKDEWRCDYLNLVFNDVNRSAYYAPYVAWAAHHGITNGTGVRAFSPDSNITREQMATMFANFLRVEGYTLTTTAENAPVYSDAGAISGWARQSVKELTAAGLLNGMNDGEGGVAFRPKKNATRAEGAAMFCRVIDAMQRSFEPVMPTGITLPESELEMTVGDVTSLWPTITPTDATNQTVLWYSTAPACVSVDAYGTISAVGAGTATVYAVTANKIAAQCRITVKEYIPEGIASGDMGYWEKCEFVFGEYTAEPRTYYASEAEAWENQVPVTVKVWQISNGDKVTHTYTLYVHKNLAATVEQIFKEIYESPDKPPIHSVGGWRWRSYEVSEHNMGMAIDLSPMENPFVYKGNDPYAAGFRPGEDPYSIPIGGTIDQIFAKYGFTRGIYWNNGNKDYMHYSFFAT